MNWIARVGALALGVAWGCTTKNDAHCGNHDGDATCHERDGAMPYCDLCTAVNDGCSNVINTNPGCHEGDVGTSSSGVASTATGDTTTMSTSMTTSMTMSTDPTDASSSGGPLPCGNGMIDEGEDCDGANLGDATCASRGFPGGELACGDACTFDDSGCTAVGDACGDGVIQEGEDCEPGDPDDLNDATCMSVANQLGGDGLACNSNCTFDTSACCIADGFGCSDNVPCCGSCFPVTNLCVASG